MQNFNRYLEDVMLRNFIHLKDTLFSFTDYSSGRNNESTKKSSEKSTPSGQKKGMPVPPPPPPPPQSPAVTVAAEVHRDQGKFL